MYMLYVTFHSHSLQRIFTDETISLDTFLNVYLKAQFSSVSQSCLTLCDPMNRSTSLSSTNSQSSLKLMSIELVMPSTHLSLCHPLLLLGPIPPSIRVFSKESTPRMRWPKYWSFSFSISPFSEHPGLISFKMDWLDLLAVQGTLKSLLQHHSSKASILRHSAFFTFQRNYHMPEVRGCGQEEQPHVHSQEGWPCGDTPHPR